MKDDGSAWQPYRNSRGPALGSEIPRHPGRDAGSFRAHRVPGGERYCQVLGLCPIAASCIAVDVAMRWSADPDVREIGRLVNERGTEIRLDVDVSLVPALLNALPSLTALMSLLRNLLAWAALI